MSTTRGGSTDLFEQNSRRTFGNRFSKEPPDAFSHLEIMGQVLPFRNRNEADRGNFGVGGLFNVLQALVELGIKFSCLHCAPGMQRSI